jgi:hypothetical protein
VLTASGDASASEGACALREARPQHKHTTPRTLREEPTAHRPTRMPPTSTMRPTRMPPTSTMRRPREPPAQRCRPRRATAVSRPQTARSLHAHRTRTCPHTVAARAAARCRRPRARAHTRLHAPTSSDVPTSPTALCRRPLARAHTRLHARAPDTHKGGAWQADLQLAQLRGVVAGGVVPAPHTHPASARPAHRCLHAHAM